MTQTSLPVAPDVHLVRSLPDTGGPVQVYVNSLVISDREPVLVDTGAAWGREEWWAQVEGLVDPADVRWIFLTHDDVDHHGNLFEALDRCPQATLVASWFIGARLSALRPLPLDRCRWVNDGERFVAGERELVALRPPAYDSPTTRGLFDVASGTYWASDCFGTTVPHAADDVSSLDLDVWVDGFSMYQRLLSPWMSDVDPLRWRAAVGRVAALGPKAIASAHGPLIRRTDVGRALDLLGEQVGLPEVAMPGQADLEAAQAAMAALAAVEQPTLATPAPA